MPIEEPPEVTRFRDQLREVGFVETDREVGPMDSAFITMERDPVQIRIVKDRGQWTLDMLPDGWPEEQRITFPLLHGFTLS